MTEEMHFHTAASTVKALRAKCVATLGAERETTRMQFQRQLHANAQRPILHRCGLDPG